MLQEDIYVKTKNYADLITLYRNELKKNEDHKMRFKLANLYYLNGDYRSSLFYLKPLLSNEGTHVYHLQAKNLISLGNYPLAIEFCDKILTFNNKNPEAYNLRGVAQSLSSRLLESKKLFITARQLFIDDVTANNNLAMVSLLNHQYHDAVNILFPLYINGHNYPRLVHNLILGLVKSGDLYHARIIIEKENISSDADTLLNALQRVDLLEIRRS
ncbi:tight adherance operon protein [Candidatus Sodalis endolongispinus]|uniref:Tight adherance operon protein n=1 Tax=Candidatus Sodalis endolongispinus TaxID=2812662 RepID=A0ABS5YEN4_9GAMM|nr:tight adherance operon protein [Candidatus Sodalis endolongispinus]MBT9433432.1 tight adherance operon protein [Candidatus Sodalis endolongispinus]